MHSPLVVLLNERQKKHHGPQKCGSLTNAGWAKFCGTQSRHSGVQIGSEPQRDSRFEKLVNSPTHQNYLSVTHWDYEAQKTNLNTTSELGHIISEKINSSSGVAMPNDPEGRTQHQRRHLRHQRNPGRKTCFRSLEGHFLRKRKGGPRQIFSSWFLSKGGACLFYFLINLAALEIT